MKIEDLPEIEKECLLKVEVSYKSVVLKPPFERDVSSDTKMFYSFSREDSGIENCPAITLYGGMCEGEYVDPINIPLENIERFSILDFINSKQ